MQATSTTRPRSSSTTLDKVEWQNSTLVKANLAQEIARLKQQPGRNIGVAGSPTLVYSLLQHDLLDELTLMIHPVVVGSGKRLCKDGGDLKRLQLVASKTTASGVALLTYRPRSSQTERQTCKLQQQIAIKGTMTFQAYLDSVEARTGKTAEDFRLLAGAKGLIEHGEIVAWLKSAYGPGHGHANAIAHVITQYGQERVSTEAAIAAHFAGKKAVWREPYDALMAAVTEFGTDLHTGPPSRTSVCCAVRRNYDAA